MIQLDLRPASKTLRQFGLICLIMLTGIGLLLKWRFALSTAAVIGLSAAGLVLFVLGLISPKLIWPFYAGLILAGFPIGWAVSHLVMILFFFGVITPVALVFRLLGRDALHRQWDRQARSYWVPCSRPDSVKRYFRQF
jgi:hypothetical protein